MNAIAWAPLILYLVELTIKIVALGTVPNNRRPSSSIAWLLLIVVTPIIGLVIFLLIGSPFVRGRRAKVQAEANQVITERTAGVPDLPAGADIPVGVDSLFRLNRALTQLPCVTGVSHGLVRRLRRLHQGDGRDGQRGCGDGACGVLHHRLG